MPAAGGQVQIVIGDRPNRSDQSAQARSPSTLSIRAIYGNDFAEPPLPHTIRAVTITPMAGSNGPALLKRPILVVAVILALSTGIVDGQAPGNVLVIEGGTLIDGNGGAPIRDVQIVVRGNRIASIGRRGTATPPGARVV